MKKTIFAMILLGVLGYCQSPQMKSAQSRNQNPETSQAGTEDDFFQDKSSDQSVNQRGVTAQNTAGRTGSGYASWIGKELQDKPTASGEMYDMNKFTAAHRDFPMGSLVMVKNTENGKKQLVKINDRGPYIEGRIIDVSYATARDLGFAEKGIAKVEIELIQEGKDDFLAKARVDEKTADEDLEAEKEETTKEEVAETEEEDTDSYEFVDGMKPKGFTIQVGAFKKRANAERARAEMEEKFDSKGFIASKGGWHYVWLGDFKSKTQADKFLKKVKAAGHDVMYRGKAM